MGPPLGVKIVSILTGFYGAMWLVAGLLWSRHPDPSVWAALGPWIGIAIVLLAVGLWRLHPLAWALTLGLYGIGLVWTVGEVTAGEPERLTGVLTGILVIAYLALRRDRFTRSDRSTPENA